MGLEEILYFAVERSSNLHEHVHADWFVLAEFGEGIAADPCCITELNFVHVLGYVATVGTTYTQTGAAPWEAWVGGTGIGLIVCALLMINNIRDIPTDSVTGKRTLAVRLGDRRARITYGAMLAGAIVSGFAIGVSHWPIAIGMIPLGAWAVVLARRVLSGLEGRALIPVLRDTGLLELAYGAVILLTIAVF